MSSLSAVMIPLLLLAFVLIIPSVLSQSTQADDIVTCHRTLADCNADINGMTATAIECCNGSTLRPYFNFGRDGCFACLVIGFRNTSVMLGPDNRGQSYSLLIDVLANPTNANNGSIDLVVRPDDQPSNINNYLSSGTGNTFFNSLPFNFNLQVPQSGNQIGLSPSIQFNYIINRRSTAVRPPAGVEWVFTNVPVTIEDIDTIGIRFAVTTDNREGGVVTATVTRDTISPEVSFTVFVKPEEYTGQLLLDERKVRANEIDFTEVKNFTFQGGSTRTSSEPLTFNLPNDEIVELTEVFQLRMTVNDRRIILPQASSGERFVIQPVRFQDIDVFNIGYKETYFTVDEGGRQKLVIVEKDDVMGGERIGGYPADRFTPATIELVPGDNATNVTDFRLDTTVPNFSYNENNTLNFVPFYPIMTVEDNLLEGDEVIRIKLGLQANSDSFQVKEESFQTATIVIRDTTPGNLTMSASSVLVLESVGFARVCATIAGGILAIPIDIPAVVIADTAIADGRTPGDYFVSTRNPPYFVFEAGDNETCVEIDIIDDSIRETLYESFNVTFGAHGILNFDNLRISQEPAVVTIQDDDQALVRFQNATASFSEGGGNQSIGVVLYGGQVASSVTVEVYIDDGTANGISLGTVTYRGGVAPPQTEYVTFPVRDDVIALESDEYSTLRFRNLNGLEVGAPSEMNITLIDDDIVTVTFDSDEYRYIESDGTANDIVVNINTPIAQDLTVTIAGGGDLVPSVQPSSLYGSEFFIGAMRNILGGRTTSFQLYITTPSVTSVPYTIESSSGVISSGIVSSTSPAGVTLPNSLITNDYSDRSNGIRVYSTNGQPLSVQVVHLGSGTYGDYLAYPYLDLQLSQYQYYAVSTGTLAHLGNALSAILLVGNADNTMVTVVPTQTVTVPRDIQNSSSDSVTLPAGSPYTFTIHRYQTLLIRAPVMDISGTSIVSNKPLTVISGHECGNVPSDVSNCQQLTAVIPPTSTWGRQFLLTPYAIRSAGPYYKIVSSDDQTTVTFTCTTDGGVDNNVTVLQSAGDVITRNTNMGRYCYITADKPVLVTQLGPGENSGTGLGDPVISVIQSIDRYQESTVLTVPDLSSITVNYLNLATTMRGPVFINNQSVTVSWSDIRDSSNNTVGYGAQINLNDTSDLRSFTLSMQSPFTALVYGFGSSIGYSYTAGHQLGPIPGIPSTVEQSGSRVNTTVTFRAGGPMSVDLPSFPIIDDLVALETDEQYPLSFTGHDYSTYPSNVQLGNPTDIIIMDDDNVTVTFVQVSYSYSEGSGSVSGVSIQLDRVIAQGVTVRVSGAPGMQPSTVDISGSTFDQTVTFTARGTRSLTLGSSPINNDATALETIEMYPLSLSLVTPITSDVILGPSTMILINDDDFVGISFSRTLYEYTEGDRATDIRVVLNTSVAQNFTISVSGSPHPQPSTVVVSGVNISETVSFIAGGSTGISLGPYQWIDDTTALETNETYSLSFSNPSISSVGLGPDASLLITDNDVVMVAFGSSQYAYTEDQGPVSNVMIRLSTSIAQPLTVTLVGGQTSQPSTVEKSFPSLANTINFTPFGVESMTLPFVIINDQVGLETVERDVLRFTGDNYGDASRVILGANAAVSVTDDDVVMVRFQQRTYEFMESDTNPQIVIQIDRVIAQSLNVGVFGEPGTQPSTVIISGRTINETVSFTARGSLTSSLSTSFIDDSTALETNEIYSVGFTGHNFPTNRVNLGDPTNITIIDDDDVRVSFGQPIYSYTEDQGVINDIEVRIDNPVATDLTVSVFGAPGTQPVTVVTSGPTISQTVTFTAGGSQSIRLNTYTITNDSYALETIEEYPLRFTGPTTIDRVILGTNSTVVITDDEVLTVSFGSSEYPTTEGDTDSILTVVLSNPIVQDFTVNINGSSGTQQYVRNNGPSIQETFTFVARGREEIPFSFNVSDDSLALENLEMYLVGLSSPSISGVILATPTTITVMDNEVLSVRFVRPSESFLENAGLTQIVTVSLSNEVTRPVTVRVYGDPGTIPPSIRNSGSTVNQTITFNALDGSMSNLDRVVPVLIVDDNVSGEDVQTYSLSFRDVPSDVQIGTYNSTDIFIIDDDEAVVRILDPVVTILESSRRASITVVLTGAINKPASVDVVDENGVVIGTANFSPSSNMTGQTVTLFVDYPDDSIALEPDMIFNYNLANASSDVRIGMPRSIRHVIVDDDPLHVQFVQSIYTFDERNGTVFIEVSISNPIASNFTFTTQKATSSQEAVFPSGANFSSMPVFTPTSPRTVRVYSDITNDNYALEDVEAYFVSIVNPDPSPLDNPYVTVGAPTRIRIDSDDIARLTFGTNNNFNELQTDTTESITVSISNPILKQLDVNISSVYQEDPRVEQSGETFTTVVTFPRGPAGQRTFNFPISADNVALEPVEREVLSFIGSSPSSGVELGPSEIATITDTDVVSVMFVSNSLVVNENDSIATVQLMISGPIRQNVSVRVEGGPDSNRQYSSGSSVDRYVQFTVDGPDKVSFSFPLIDDMVALETVEMYILNLTQSIPTTGVTLGGPLTVSIIDDDSVTVSFNRSLYVYKESDPVGSIVVMISNPVATSFNISTTRILTSQQYVSRSGPLFTDQFRFGPNSPLSVTVTRSIDNDEVALEDLEVYDVMFTSLMPSNNPSIIVGAPTTVNVMDDDNVTVTFGRNNDFFELPASRNESILVSINTAIIRDLVVDVSSVYQMDPLVAQSGRTYNTSVTFVQNQSGPRTFNFPIFADNVAFEAVEREVLSFTGSSPSGDNVILGPNEIATITDTDVVSVMFVSNSLVVNENDSIATVQLMISGPIRQNVSVRVEGGPDSNRQYSSGSSVDRYVQFTVDGPDKVSFSFPLIDDMVALETVEMYILNLTQSIPTTGVTLGGPLTVSIIDDDILTVMFTNPSSVIDGVPNYNFTESSTTAGVTVTIDRPIARDFTVQVQGGPGSQPSTVVISGPDTSSSLIFRPNRTQSIQLPLSLTDDIVAMEDVETYRLSLTNPSSNDVILGEPARINIYDDDVLQFGFFPNTTTVVESDGPLVVTFVVSPSATPNTFNFTTTKSFIPNVVTSQFGNINCGQNPTTGLLTVPSSSSVTRISCTVNITDDPVAGENDEIVRFTPNLVGTDDDPPRMGTPLNLTVQDDDVVVVSVVSTSEEVAEGEVVRLCVRSNITSLQPVYVVLRVSDGTATSPSDYQFSGLYNLTIPPMTTGPACIRIPTTNDTAPESNETFTGTIVGVSSPDPPTSSQPRPPVIGPNPTTNVTIIDMSPDTKTCRFNSNGVVRTFNGQDSYPYNKSCEHSLIQQRVMDHSADFSLSVDSLDGTFRTTRVGVRFGAQELVVNAYNRTVIRAKNLTSIMYSSTADMFDIIVPVLRLNIRITSDFIDVTLGSDSILSSHLGLCGDRNGNFVFRNGTEVDTSDSMAMNTAINQYLAPPSEGFVRTVARRQCGLLGEDVETGDPMYAVPLWTPGLPRAHTYSLCYEIHGTANDYYNFISDGCTSVNGHYFSTADPDPEATRNFHAVDAIHVYAVNKNSQCVNITVTLDRSTSQCTTRLGNTAISNYNDNGIEVSVSGNSTSIKVPNCVDGDLVMTVNCNVTMTGISYQEFRVVRGLNLNEESHGIIGQFWNVEANVTKYDQPLRDGTIDPRAYRVDFKPRNKPQRSFIGFLESVTWNYTPQSCLYVGNSQGGPIYEVLDEEPNDSLLEGDFTQYKMDSAFDTTYQYSHFESNRCQ